MAITDSRKELPTHDPTTDRNARALGKSGSRRNGEVCLHAAIGEWSIGYEAVLGRRRVIVQKASLFPGLASISRTCERGTVGVRVGAHLFQPVRGAFWLEGRAMRATGNGWSEPAVIHEDAWQIHGCPVNGPAIAADGRRVAVAWFTAAEARAHVKAALSTDGGATFGGRRRNSRWSATSLPATGLPMDSSS